MLGITDPRAQRWINGTGGWELPYQGSQSSVSTQTFVVGATSFPLNWWTLAGLANPLPISLLEFKGTCENDDVVLRWTTGTEQNNEKFTLLRGRDGVSYEVIGYKQGSGTISTPVPYSFTDAFAPAGLNYYKLRQTDYDGNFSEFGPIVVESCAEVKTFGVTVIPSNPTQTDVLLTITNPGTYKFVLYTMEGKPVYSTERTFETSGLNVTSLNHGPVSSAIYILRVEGTKDAVSKKIPLGLTR
jgi:hypothetical protein